MAKQGTWDKLKYFNKYSKIDRWGDVDAISDETLLRLDDFRRSVGIPIYVLRGAETKGHKSTSYHYGKKDASGNWIEQPSAVDVILPKFEHSPFDLITEAARFGWAGIGYYPDWTFNGKKVGGLHLDCRMLRREADGTLDYRFNRWMGIKVLKKDRHGVDYYIQEYIALTFHNIWKYTQGENYAGSNRLS